ncbi:DUF4023 domain-containing protein [Bacillus sp. BGMRC 2118]|nr:DUF4023 domain-containing protein [Bacillus sp. BGMRC 2118]
MESTHEFVENLHERQAKDEQNKKRQAKGHEDEKLPNNQKSNGNR